jgi:hypothetical protein
MNATQAINILIERNQLFVNKNGVSSYSELSDKIINVLLEFVHDKTTEINQLKEENERHIVLIELCGLTRFTYIEPEYLSRYLTHEIKTGFNLDPDLEEIERRYQYFRTMIEYDFNEYLFFKEMYPTIGKRLKDINPSYCHYIENNYPDDEVKKLIKNSLLYNYERK